MQKKIENVKKMWYINKGNKYYNILTKETNITIREILELGIVKEEIAKNILYYRKKRGLTRKALAEKIGVSASAVVKWEMGDNSIDMDTLLELCEVLNVSMYDMFGKCSSIKSETFSMEEKDNIFKVRQLNEEGKKYVVKQIDYALQQEEYILTQSEKSPASKR